MPPTFTPRNHRASRRLAAAAVVAIALLLPNSGPAPSQAAGPAPTPTPAAAAPGAIPRASQPVEVRRGNETVQVRPPRTVRTADGREAVADRILVGYRSGTGPEDRARASSGAAARGAGAAQSVAAVGPTAELVDVSGAPSLEAAVAAFQADPRVQYAEPDLITRAVGDPSASPAAVPNDPSFGLQWGMSVIHASAAWDVTHGSSARTVAVLDCGIYDATSSVFPGHPDLNGKVAAHQDFTGSAHGADDYCDHGTHVAGIAAASTNNGVGVAGVGYDTRLINAKVLGDNGSGTTTWIANGIYWATDQGANVINMSLGRAGACSTTEQDAIDYAWSHNVVVVAAAGNNNSSGLFAPASCNHVLSVASTDASDARSSFSNYGPQVDVAAPGGYDAYGNKIYSTDYLGVYAYKAGTSMAAPHVSGLAALLWATGRYTTAQQVVDRITSTADQVAGTGTYWHDGRIDAAAALAAPATAPGTTWYFAEGYTGTGFDEYLTILNPGSATVAVTTTYYLASGGPVVKTRAIPPATRTTLAVHSDTDGVGRNQAVSAKVEGSGTIVAERPMYFSYGSGWTGGHDAMGATAPSTTWYFAEGYTGTGFDEYLTLQNPNGSSASATITYYLGSGGPVVKIVNVPANGRYTVAVHDTAEGVGRNQAVSAKVESDLPIVAERPMYFSYGPAGWTGGHVALGATAPNTTWYFAEGYTGTGFDEYLTLQNPNSSATSVTITYYLGSGGPVVRTVNVPASSRYTVAVHDTAEGVGRNQAVSAKIQSSLPIVAERPMYFNYGPGWTGGHDVMGANAPKSTWYFAEGYTGTGFDEYLTLQNPNSSATNVIITYYLTSGDPMGRVVNVPANSRATVAVHDTAEGVGRNQAVSAKVESDLPIVAERPMYFSYGAGWTGGHVVLGYAP